MLACSLTNPYLIPDIGFGNFFMRGTSIHLYYRLCNLDRLIYFFHCAAAFMAESPAAFRQPSSTLG